MIPEQTQEIENLASSRSTTSGCTSNETCFDNIWCNCYNFNYPSPPTSPIPCGYTFENECQVYEAFHDHNNYADWSTLFGACPNTYYVDESDCGFECCIQTSDFIGGTYADICNALTEALNAYLECFFLDFTTTIGCEDCDQLSYEGVWSFTFDDPCNAEFCLSGLYVECCSL